MKATRAGLLTPKGAVGELFEAVDRMEAEGGMPMTEDEVQAEVDAVRAARRAARDL